MLEKLKQCGIRGKSYSLFKSYLSDRDQMVQIDKINSSLQNVTFGIPQGTVLGPVLFTLYVNSLLHQDISGKILSFADDTVILYTSPSWENLKLKIENDFSKVGNWLQHNKLTLNYNKTTYLPFSSYVTGLPALGSLKVGLNQEISESKSVKYLGVHIDRHMRWDIQVKELVKKIRGLLPKFKYLRDFVSIQSLKTVYYSLTQSLLVYGIIGWGGVQDNYLKDLNTVQKWIIKTIYKKDIRYPSNSLYSETKILDLRQLYFLKIVLFIKKRKIDLTTYNHTHNTRRFTSTYLPRSGKTVGQRSVDYLAPRVYVSLPKEIRDLPRYNTFKIKTKEWMYKQTRELFNNLINSFTLT